MLLTYLRPNVNLFYISNGEKQMLLTIHYRDLTLIFFISGE